MNVYFLVIANNHTWQSMEPDKKIRRQRSFVLTDDVSKELGMEIKSESGKVKVQVKLICGNSPQQSCSTPSLGISTCDLSDESIDNLFIDAHSEEVLEIKSWVKSRVMEVSSINPEDAILLVINLFPFEPYDSPIQRRRIA